MTLKKRIAVVNPNVSEKDIANITNSQNQITDENYQQLCEELDLEGHDPIAGAFKFLDDGTGAVNFNVVNKFLESFNHEKLEEKDIEILHEFLDIDKDGRLTLEDFRRIFRHLGR